MLCFLHSLAVSASWTRIETIKPPTDVSSLFGRSVAYCSKLNRLVVGAEFEANYLGYIYVFEEVENKWKYITKMTIDDPYQKINQSLSVNLQRIGSSIQISSDCNYIIAGAPFSNFTKDGVVIPEVGAVIKFNITDMQKPTYKTYIPKDIVKEGGYGRSIAGSSDMKFFAAAYYNRFGKGPKTESKVYVHYNVDDAEDYVEREIENPVPDLDHYRFGSDMQFLDASTLMVGTAVRNLSQTGVYLYKRSNGLWKSLTTMKPECKKYDIIGEHIGMANNNQNFAAISARNSETKMYGIIFMQFNDTTNEWNLYEVLDLDKEYQVDSIDFCGPNMFSVVDFMSNSDHQNSAVHIFERSGKTFKITQSVSIPPEDDIKSHYLNFGSDFAWESSHCSRFVVGAMSKHFENGEHVPYNYSRVYIYERRPDIWEITDIKDSTIFIIGFLAGVVIVIVVSVIVFYVLRYKKRRGAQQIP